MSPAIRLTLGLAAVWAGVIWRLRGPLWFSLLAGLAAAMYVVAGLSLRRDYSRVDNEAQRVLVKAWRMASLSVLVFLMALLLLSKHAG